MTRRSTGGAECRTYMRPRGSNGGGPITTVVAEKLE